MGEKREPPLSRRTSWRKFLYYGTLWRPGAQRAALRPAGFTLVELLLVVAIIALLIAILLPALRAARVAAGRAKCSSNVHQVALAWNMYLDAELPGVFPKYTKNIQWFYGGKIHRVQAPALGVRPLNRYLGQDPYENRVAEIFHCPSDRGFEYVAGPVQGHRFEPSSYNYFGNSYPANSIFFAVPAKPPVRRVDVRLPPSMVVMIGDHGHIDLGRGNILTNWHDGAGLKLNLGFLDGRAEFVTLQRGIAQTARYSYVLDWDPNAQPPPIGDFPSE